MLKVRGLMGYYGRSHIVQGVDLDLSAGQITALLGRNGVGKTTTLKAIMGLIRRSGSVMLDGVELMDLPPHVVADAGIGYVPQGRELFSELTVRENILLCAKTSINDESFLEPLLAYFPALRPLAGRRAGTLSGGEQQMVAVARAIAREPKVILMDEPIEGLAPTYIRIVRDVIGVLAKQQKAILLVEQNYKLALEVADEVLFMDKGRIVHALSGEEGADQTLIHKFLGVSAGH